MVVLLVPSSDVEYTVGMSMLSGEKHRKRKKRQTELIRLHANWQIR